MGGKSGGGQQWQQAAYENAYNAASSGQDWGTIASNTDQNYVDYARAGYDAAGGGSRGGGGGFSMPEIPQPQQPDYAAQQADYAAQQAAEQRRQAEELARQQGVAERDNLYSTYMDSAGQAADFINQRIAEERSNAKLSGVDYVVTDEEKSARVSDYFASVWGAGQQSRLENLMSQWGNPKGFSGFTVARGDASQYAEATPGAETSASTSVGVKPKIATDEEEQGVLGAPSVLGV